MENTTINDLSAEPFITKINCLYLEEEWIAAREIFFTYLILIVLNSLTALTAVIGNMLILLAVSRTPTLRTPSNTLLCCLAFADLLVGLVVQPTYTLQMVFEIQRNARSFCITKIMTTGSLSWICAGVSFLVISAISVERLLAIKLHLRYKALITVRRVLTVVVGFWILCTALTTARFLGVSYQSLVIIIVVMDVVCIAITVYAYLNIYLRVRKLQNNRMQLAPPGMNISSFKRSAVTVLYIMALFLACYIPFLSMLVVRMRQGVTLKLNIIYNFTAAIVYMNSSDQFLFLGNRARYGSFEHEVHFVLDPRQASSILLFQARHPLRARVTNAFPQSSSVSSIALGTNRARFPFFVLGTNRARFLFIALWNRSSSISIYRARARIELESDFIDLGGWKHHSSSFPQ